MSFLFIIILFGTGVYSTKDNWIVQSNIVGGTEVDIKDYPYQVALVMDGDLWCGGSIISENHVLSAAHCWTMATSPIIIHAGTSFWSKPGTVHNVDSQITYEGASDMTDVLILRVKQPFVFDETHRPIPLFNSADIIKPDTIATVTGWGTTTNEGQDSANRLMSVNVPIVDTNKCNSSYGGKIYKTEICAGIVGKDACKGDSGGPLAINGQQVGIVTTGNGCGLPNFPGVYANVSFFYEWIMEHIKK